MRERKRKLHWAIAEHLEATSAARPAEQFGRLAHHYTEAGLTEQAVDYWRRAGHRAIERSANAEAGANWRRYRCVRRNTDAAHEDYQDPPRLSW